MSNTTNIQDAAREAGLPSTSTPWGEAQHITLKAPGIVLVSTATHGGIWVDQARWLDITLAFPGWQAFGDYARWFEEDCDWTVVALTFPDAFSMQDVWHAYTIAKGYRPEVLATFLATEKGQALWPALDQFKMDVVDTHWQRGSMSTHGKCWEVWFSKPGHEDRTVLMPDYPAKTFYTDAELGEFQWSLVEA